MDQSIDQTHTVEFTLIELMNYLVGKCQEVTETSERCFPISYSYLCHVAEVMVRRRGEFFDEGGFSKQLSDMFREFFDEGGFSKQLSDMFPDEVLDKKKFKFEPNTFGIEECISQEDMFKFYKRGCEIYGKPIPPELDISCYNSYAYNNVEVSNVSVFHRTMAKIGMLDMLVQRNPDGVFEIECVGY